MVEGMPGIINDSGKLAGKFNSSIVHIGRGGA
jgi:hypothetical protein